MQTNIFTFAERVGFVAYLPPLSRSAAAYTSTEFDLLKARRIVAIVQAGVLGSSATLDFKFQLSTTSGGSLNDVSGLAITQLVKASNDNMFSVLEFRGEQVGSLGYRYGKGVLTVGTAASVCGLLILALDGPLLPMSALDLSSSVIAERKVWAGL